MPTTTIKLDTKTKERIDKLRVYKRETYDEIVQSVLTILNLCKVNPERARARLMAIDNARRKGKITRGSADEPARAPQYNRQSL